MPLPFTHSPELTLGVELELQLIDPKTRDLNPAALRVFERLGGEQLHIKPEIFQSMVEINTGICKDVAAVRADLEKAVGTLREVCDDLGLELAASGSHPFARYAERLVYPAERYENLILRNRWIARRIMIFGLHVHIGMRDGDHAMAMINGFLHYLPHLLALTASSPYWQGDDTGLASSRITIFESMPTAGAPCTFATWDEFVTVYDAMCAAGSIESVKDLWWDIRPHPGYGTIEIRICDDPTSLGDTVAIVALVHSLAKWLDGRYRGGEKFTPPPGWMLRENKWRASRDGVEASLIADEKGRTVTVVDAVTELLKTLEPFAEEVGAKDALARIENKLRGDTSYRRQREVLERKGSLFAVVDALIEEFRGA